VTLEEARAAFPVLEQLAHLNAGTFGPLARTTIDAVTDQAARELEAGRGGKPYYDAIHAARAAARDAVAGVLGVGDESVALVYSTSAACNVVLAGLGLGPDDEVVTTDVEHFGLLGPLHASGARVRVAAVRDRPPEEALDAILAEVGPRTRLLALSHVSWATGNLLPVREAKEATGLPVLVDGAQSIGAIPVDPGPLDFYTVSGQKWLCGPDATGALYVADPERLRVALPTYFSLARYEPDGSFEPREGAARFDSGAIPLPSLAGLTAAIAGAPEWRYERAAEQASRCRDLLARGYEIVTAPGQATLVSLRWEGDAAAATASAYERGVLIRDIPTTGWLRVSVGYWTSDGDLEQLLDALSTVA
jgi:L-cysteine/cystine lyase